MEFDLCVGLCLGLYIGMHYIDCTCGRIGIRCLHVFLCGWIISGVICGCSEVESYVCVGIGLPGLGLGLGELKVLVTRLASDVYMCFHVEG